MNNEQDNILDEIVKKAKAAGSFLFLATIREKDKEENNLHHYQIRREFLTDDIVPSIDAALRSMQINPITSQNVVIPPKIEQPQKPLKIAIITHFNRAPNYYSPARAVRNQIKMLQKYGHEVVFFAAEGSQLDWGCEIRPVVPRFKRIKNVVNTEIKQKFIEILKKELTPDFNLVITHDLYIDDCITYREAIKECGIDIQWLHWARSGVGRPLDFNMPNARYVYMNYADVDLFAQHINVPKDRVRVVFNEKDPSLIFDWHPITSQLVEKMALSKKDIIQTYPMCTTRMDAKGIDSVIRAFGHLKAQGKEVALIICNANAQKRAKEVQTKLQFAYEQGLTEKDILFTSTTGIPELERETDHRIVIDLFRLSNLFIFPTMAEVCSNVLLEASMSKNLVVLNSDLPSLMDFAAPEQTLTFPFTSLRSVHYHHRDEASYTELADKIIKVLGQNKADAQFRHVWKHHSLQAIYEDMLAPILYE